MYRDFAAAILVALCVTATGAAQFTPRDSYLRIEDSPFLEFGVEGTLVWEDFEDGELNIPGVREIPSDNPGDGNRFIGQGFSVAADTAAGSPGLAFEARPTICATS